MCRIGGEGKREGSGEEGREWEGCGEGRRDAAEMWKEGKREGEKEEKFAVRKTKKTVTVLRKNVQGRKEWEGRKGGE